MAHTHNTIKKKQTNANNKRYATKMLGATSATTKCTCKRNTVLNAVFKVPSNKQNPLPANNPRMLSAITKRRKKAPACDCVN